MKIFLTGGTGFIGSHFLKRALAAGHTVVATRRPGSQPKIAIGAEPNWLDKPLDVLSPIDFDGCDAVVHFASAGVSPQKASWAELMHWNVVATMHLLEQAHAASVRRIVIAGTFAEYGKSADRYERIPPDAPLLPTYAYAGSKAAAFEAAYAFALEHAIELCYLRIFSAYGEGQYEGNFWPALRKAALAGMDFEMTDGEQVRDYIPVERVADVFLRALDTARVAISQPLVCNVGSGTPVSMREFAEHWWKQWNAKGSLLVGALPYRANEVMHFLPVPQDF